MPHVAELLRRGVQMRAHEIPRYQCARRNLLTFTTGQQYAARTFFRRVTAQRIKVPRSAVLRDPFAGLIRRFGDHVHAVRVAGEVTKVRNDFPAYLVTVDVNQFAVTGGGFGLGAHNWQIILYELSEFVSFDDILKYKNRTDAILVEGQARDDASCASEGTHAPFVGTHQPAFGRRQRPIKRDLRMFAVDQKRAGDAERHLRRADWIFNVAAHPLAGNRACPDVIKTTICLFFEPLPPATYQNGCIALILKARHQLDRVIRPCGTGVASAFILNFKLS